MKLFLIHAVFLELEAARPEQSVTIEAIRLEVAAKRGPQIIRKRMRVFVDT